MPEVSGKLDVGLTPGNCSVQQWQSRVNRALSKNPEFTRVGKEGKAVVWRLNTAHTPAEPASKATKREKGKFMGKGKSMGQGGH